jgi:carbamoyltransferase
MDMNDRVILGLNCSHDAAACLAVDGQVVCAIAEERLNRRKHFKGYPQRAVDYCLDAAGLTNHARVPDLVVINQLPPADHDRAVASRFPHLPADRILVNPSHHLLHACYAEMLAPEEPMVILVVDGSGYSYAEHNKRNSPLLGAAPPSHDAMESLSAYYRDADGQLTLLMKDWGEFKEERRVRFPSLGHMYGLAAQHVFGSWVHAGKLMGLAPFGDPEAFGDRRIVTLRPDGVDVDTEWILDVPPIGFDPRFEHNPLARNLAAKVQAELEVALWHLARLLHERTKCDTLCLSGGVALNSVFNGQLMREGPYRRVLVTPAAHDGGTAIGAAAYGYQRLTKRTLAFRGDEEMLGRTYRESEIVDAAAEYPDVVLSRVANPIRAAAEELAAGHVIGWFEGGSEFGPRALGHRSILADPRVAGMKDHLNAHIKFREGFRPYAAAVLEERCSEWFEDAFDSPHMLAVFRVRPSCADRIPAVVHVDGSCRLQTVAPDYSGSLRALIEAFYALTGVPLILNTSLNVHGEPMSEQPRDAFECVGRSGLKRLYCGGWVVQKRVHVTTGLDDADLVAVPAKEFRLVSEYRKDGERLALSKSWVDQESRRVEVSEIERRIVLAGLEEASMADMAALFPETPVDEVRRRVDALCDQGVLCLRPRTQPVEVLPS